MKPIDSKSPFIAVAESRIGGRSENQDTCAWQDTPHGLLLLVCDGMGGGPSGKLASQMAADVIVNSVLDSKLTSDRRDVLERAIRNANKSLIAAQESDTNLRGMGTTVTALLINDRSAVVAHVGDSRVYLLRGAHKVFRTFDHSHVFELVKAKALTEEEARLSGESNIITRALGPMEKVDPDIEELPYEKGDRFMLCTDGIWGALPEKELIKIAGGTKSLSGAVESLAIKVDELGRSHGNNHDNLTVAMLQTPFNSKLKQKMSTKVKYTLYVLVAIAGLSLLANIIQYKQYHHSSQSAAESTGNVIPDSIVTRSELDRILAEEREKYREQAREQDEYYQARVQQLRELLRNPSASAGSADTISAEIELVQKINTLINQVEKIGKIKSQGADLNDAVVTASKEMNDLNSTVKKLKISDDKFDKCIKNQWITNPMIKKVDDSKRGGHIKAIIESLESLKKQIQSKNRKS